MFKLDYLTPPEWVEQVEAEDVCTLLADHAHCELKAASSAQGILSRGIDNPALMVELARVAIDEMEHFELVLHELHRRGGQLGQVQENPYADRLHRAAASNRSNRLLDRLIVSGLIEARSLERFHLLSEGLHELKLASLYRGLMASEAGHQRLFFSYATEMFGEEAEQRIAELRRIEGEIVASLPFAVAVHSGLCVS
ncbi:MAG: tRNA-(ms[2]io[6]A)-hydroxylase [Planctomycetota bacterium]|jgi:tRNA-(ms[2]io[6]A)-hydroxylase